MMIVFFAVSQPVWAGDGVQVPSKTTAVPGSWLVVELDFGSTLVDAHEQSQRDDVSSSSAVMVEQGEEREFMAHSVGFKWGSVSITGNYRENNEDRCYVDSEARFFLVADGMGGQSAGEKASELAIELISQKLNQLISVEEMDAREVISRIDRSVSHANMEIMALGELEPRYKNMGTTIVFIVVANESLYVGGVGDSRAYLLREDNLEQVTEDHSLTQALVNAGTISPDEAATHRYKNVLYRYLGTKDGGAGTDPRQITPMDGDRLMLCSDGVSDGADPSTIQRVLSEITEPQEAAEELVQTALAGGSKDNITCIVVDVTR